MNNLDKTTTATDVLRKISLYVTPLGPSERQEVAALRSNGIKGNSQSTGKFVRNMKRKYKGYSIPSRSFVQQDDESRQQRNSYEVAEKISIKRTICKKMKTSAMKMPLPGTTSSLPFASSFRTSDVTADEDWSKVDDQVSDADDSSTSTSSVMKMPLPRTTSTIPFASVFPTSSAPADEDESKPDQQVSAAADTSTSTSSSTSEKEV